MTGQQANVGMYSTRLVHKNTVDGNAYITVGDPCKCHRISFLCVLLLSLLCRFCIP